MIENMRQEFDFRMRKLVLRAAADEGLLIEPERVHWDIIEQKGKQILQAMFTMATQEHVVEGVRFPADWKEAVKERWLPKFFRNKFPVQYKEVVAEHKFPELDPPLLGKEFVHLEVRNEHQ